MALVMTGLYIPFATAECEKQISGIMLVTFTQQLSGLLTFVQIH